jgi:hypothetical protein
LSAVEPTDLVGAYRLVSFEITYSDGREPSYPFGRDGRGQLIYSAEGQMSAVLTRAEREPIAVSRLENYMRADDAAKAAAFDSYLSYCGTWELDGEEVTHHVEMAMVPDIVGASQVREVTLVGDTLTLSYEVEAKSGVTRFYELVWERVFR